MRRIVEGTAVLLALAAAVGCGKRDGGGSGGGGRGSGGNGDLVNVQEGIVTEPLTESELKTFIEVWPELVQRMKKYQGGGNFWGKGIAANAEIRGFAASKGTSVERLVATMAKIGQATAAQAVRQVNLDQAFQQQKAALEAMAANPALPADQRAAIQRQLAELEKSQAEAKANQGQWAAVPQQSIDLVTKYKDEITRAQRAESGE